MPPTKKQKGKGKEEPPHLSSSPLISASLNNPFVKTLPCGVEQDASISDNLCCDYAHITSCIFLGDPAGA
jgi:hypothetical protein